VEHVISKLYIWMGYHLDAVEEVSAGSICAIPDLGEHHMKYATIADDKNCPLLNKIKFDQNLLKVSIRTKEFSEMNKLNEGLKILKKVDPAIDVFYDEKGEIIIESSGEVHLERCIKDLEDDFAKVKVEVSEPIVMFKETITCNKYKSRQSNKKDVIKEIKTENKKVFKEDNMKIVEKPEEQMEELTKENATKEPKTKKTSGANPEAKEEEDEKKDKFRFNTESSSFFETTSEEEPVEVEEDDETLYDPNRKDEADSRFIYRESNFVYQKKRQEEIKVVKKGVNLKMNNQAFLGLKKAKNHCEVLTQNKKFKLLVRAVSLGVKTSSWLEQKKSKIKKMFSGESKYKRREDFVKFFKALFKVMSEEHDSTFIRMVIRNLVSFGPKKCGPNILLCKFVEQEDTLTKEYLFDDEELGDVFLKAQKPCRYNRKDPNHPKYYPGLFYEEMLKSLKVGFEISLQKGPMCLEEMYGCVFIVEDFINLEEEAILKQTLIDKLKTKEEAPPKPETPVEKVSLEGEKEAEPGEGGSDDGNRKQD
jgi:translation elongation factor EF-G